MSDQALTTNQFTHFDEAGNARMVDVGGKNETVREATASGAISLSAQAFQLVREGNIAKGDVLGVARLAGIMAAKKSTKKIKVDKEDAKKRVTKILPILKKEYPRAKTALEFGSPLQLLISTILSAQCTDVRVNIVAKEIYKKYKDAADWAGADVKEIENDIKSTGFYRNKAKNIKAACEQILSDYNGKVPATMDELLKLRFERLMAYGKFKEAAL